MGDCSSSLWLTTSMVDLGEELEFAVRRGKYARHGLSFCGTFRCHHPARYHCYTPVLVVLVDIVLDLHVEVYSFSN